MEPLFTTYEEYERYVTEEWNAGAINELEAEGLIILDEVQEDGNRTYRALVENEFNQKLNQQ